VLGEHLLPVPVDGHRGVVPADRQDQVLRHGLRQPQRLDPALLGAQAAGSRDDPAPAGDHGQDVAAVRVVAGPLLGAIGVEAAPAVRVRARVRLLVVPQAARGVGAVVPGRVGEQGVQVAVRADPEGAQRPDLPHLRLETGEGLHWGYLAGAGSRLGSGRSGDAGAGAGSGSGRTSMRRTSLPMLPTRAA